MRRFVAAHGRAIVGVTGHWSVTKGTQSGVARSRGEEVMFYGDGWWVMMTIGMVFMALIVGLVLMWLMRLGPMGRRDDDRDTDSAIEVLRRRYAAGEISDEEFDAKRRKLEGR